MVFVMVLKFYIRIHLKLTEHLLHDKEGKPAWFRATRAGLQRQIDHTCIDYGFSLSLSLSGLAVTG